MNQDTLQAKQTFVQKVYDAVEAYLEANDCTIYASDGVYVDAQLEPTIMDETDAEDPDRFYPSAHSSAKMRRPSRLIRPWLRRLRSCILCS